VIFAFLFKMRSTILPFFVATGITGANAFSPLSQTRMTTALNYGWDEYNKAQAGAVPAPAPVAAPVPVAVPVPVAAPVAPAPAPVPVAAPVAPMAGGDPITTFAASQEAAMSKIAASIPDLEFKTDLSWDASAGIAIGGNPATLDGRDAPGPTNIAWCANVNVANKMSSLTIFNGPLTDVPHLLSRCIMNDDNTMSLVLDFRPRAYGAYEMKDAAGNYPGPDVLGRDAFTYSGNRKEFETKFGTPEVESFLSSTVASLEGAVVNTESNEFELLTNGPLCVKVTMPVTDGNVATVAAARATAADYWLTWALEDIHDHRPGAPINSQYVYDTKYRQNCYAALLPYYNAAFGAEGGDLCAAESGPLDEGYVGGGS